MMLETCVIMNNIKKQIGMENIMDKEFHEMTKLCCEYDELALYLSEEQAGIHYEKHCQGCVSRMA